MTYWQQCLKWLKECKNIKIPRCYALNITEAKKTQLIIFGDAGKEMLCTVGYIRLVDKNNMRIKTSLIAAKSYAVPIKQKRSIPELELDVAAKAVQLNRIITSSHSIKFDEHIYATDNACVFHWITNGPQKPSQYVKNRFNKISTETKISEWIWIPTEWQPADFGTKFDSLPQMKYENNWFVPPIFSLPEENWVQLKPPCDIIQKSLNVYLEKEVQPKINDCQAGYLDFKRYSSWNKYIQVTQLALKWKYLASKKVRRLREEIKKTSDVTPKEALKIQINEYLSNVHKTDFLYEEAENAIFRAIQRQCFEEEICTLKNGAKLPKSSNLKKICPYLDKDDGLLRSKTRIPISLGFNKDKISPIILPKNHLATVRLILKYHENNKHVHEKTVIANLLQRFYIPNIRWTVKKIIRENCMRCKRNLAKPDQPQMGDLPSYRLAMHQPPFSFICIDVCGPFEVKRNRGHEKRWILVSTCLKTRAVHMEILHSMNTESCLKALQNTICLRGAPCRIISDCGSNFIGCNNLLKESQDRWNLELLQKGVITKKIIWEFNPAKASHMSGSVERMIGLIKQVLKNLHNTLSTKMLFPDDETLRNIICEVIGMLNNRPLSMEYMEGDEHTLLTPNHFLMLRGNFQSTSSDNHYKDKWLDFTTPLKVGDIVVVADPTISSLWRLATIVKAEQGSNNQVRKLTLRLGKRSVIKNNKGNAYKEEKFTKITRPATQVAPLNLSSKAIANNLENIEI
ncbi:hypothetical protein PVAND_012818 [Polypedilum vanderplanki]|uniref:Integrase catalytic domain-containing protein n=1 Tax=Polypedilum vanderplanki TaxID=319348 RepID=A0A9J6CNL1_POLVA|nr:hypothetical protein PVAND_012818 [Polypedilum vanderplanki]